MTHQQKSGRKADAKRYDKGSDMWLECQDAYIQYLLVQNIVIGDKIYENVEECIEATTGCVAESLYGKYFSKRRIEKINKRNDLLFWHIV